MSTQDLVAEFTHTREAYEALGQALAPLAERLAVATIAGALPGTASLEVRGEINEDWLPILRVQRVLSVSGEVLFDLAEGHADARVESVIDEANTEYLDLLLDLTGDSYMGHAVLGD
jgi:hypothetical protein